MGKVKNSSSVTDKYTKLIKKILTKLPMDSIIDDLLDDGIILKLPMGLVEEIDNDNTEALLFLPNILSESVINELITKLEHYTDEAMDNILAEQAAMDIRQKEANEKRKLVELERKRHIQPKSTCLNKAVELWSKLVKDYIVSDHSNFMRVNKDDAPDIILSKLEANITLFKKSYQISGRLEDILLAIKNLIIHRDSKLIKVLEVNDSYSDMCELVDDGTHIIVVAKNKLYLSARVINLLPLDIYLAKNRPILNVSKSQVRGKYQVSSIDGLGYLMISGLPTDVNLSPNDVICELEYL